MADVTLTIIKNIGKYKVGDRLVKNHRHAMQLVAVGVARLEDDDRPEPRKKRVYRRRDMSVEA